MYKPVILIGNGMRNDREFLEQLSNPKMVVPLLTTWMGCDLVAEDNPAFCGRPGILGQRAANIIQQKATHLYCLGARLDGEQVFYNYDKFAPKAKIFIYDIDDAEFRKFPSRFKRVEDASYSIRSPEINWLSWCRNLYDRFRPELDGVDGGKFIDPFYFMDLLGKHTRHDDVFAIGSSGNAPTTFFQTFKVKHGQRIHNCSTIGAMGADIPMALGSALASRKRTICVTGDGGFQLNAQELETVRRTHMPITFFVFNNNGYASIRNNQKIRFDGRVTGADPHSGLTLPALEDLALGYRIPYMKLTVKDLPNFGKCFDYSPMIVEVMVDPDWAQYPRAMSNLVDGKYVNDDMSDMTPKIPDLQELMAWDG